MKNALLATTTGSPIEVWFQSLPPGLTRAMKPEWVKGLAHSCLGADRLVPDDGAR
jgi:hypothetical protein